MKWQFNEMLYYNSRLAGQRILQNRRLHDISIQKKMFDQYLMHPPPIKIKFTWGIIHDHMDNCLMFISLELATVWKHEIRFIRYLLKNNNYNSHNFLEVRKLFQCYYLYSDYDRPKSQKQDMLIIFIHFIFLISMFNEGYCVKMRAILLLLVITSSFTAPWKSAS